MSVVSPFARALVPAFAMLTFAAPSVASPASDLSAVETHLAQTQSLVSSFVQTDGKGRSLTGTLTLKRPGRIRFEYGRGANMLLVANGKTLTFIDYDVGQKSNLGQVAKSPLAVLLSSNPDLGRIARVVPSNDPRVVVVRTRDARHPEFGTLVLAFTRGAGPAGLQLEGWTAIDAQNKTTKVRLDGQRYNVAVAESDFTYPEPKRRR